MFIFFPPRPALCDSTDRGGKDMSGGMLYTVIAVLVIILLVLLILRVA
jgi:hypothetical protein